MFILQPKCKLFEVGDNFSMVQNKHLLSQDIGIRWELKIQFHFSFCVFCLVSVYRSDLGSLRYDLQNLTVTQLYF